MLQQYFPKKLPVFPFRLVPGRIFQQPGQCFRPFFRFNQPVTPVTDIKGHTATCKHQYQQCQQQIQLCLLPFHRQNQVGLRKRLLRLVLTPDSTLQRSKSIGYRIIIARHVQHIKRTVTCIIYQCPIYRHHILFRQKPVPALATFPLLIQIVFRRIKQPFFQEHFHFHQISHTQLHRVDDILLHTTNSSYCTGRFIKRVSLHLGIVTQIMHYLTGIFCLHCQFYAALHVIGCRIILVQPHGNSHREEASGSCVQSYGGTESFYRFLIIFPDIHIPVCLINQHISHSSRVLQRLGQSYAAVNGSYTPFVLFQPIPVPGFQLIGKQILRRVVAEDVIIGSRQYQGIFRHRVVPLIVHISIQPSIQQPLLIRKLRWPLYLYQQGIHAVHIHIHLLFCQM